MESVVAQVGDCVIIKTTFMDKSYCYQVRTLTGRPVRIPFTKLANARKAAASHNRRVASNTGN